MAKKSTATRQTNAARRPQTNTKATAVKLVRQDGGGMGSGTATPVARPQLMADMSRSTSVATKAVAKPTAAKPVSVAPARPIAAGVSAARPTSEAAGVASGTKPTPVAPTRPTTPVASAAPVASSVARGQAARAEAAKIARARELHRTRTANLITPEHYNYVTSDLRLIGSLAVCMFAIIIVLHFVLG